MSKKNKAKHQKPPRFNSSPGPMQLQLRNPVAELHVHAQVIKA